MTHTLNLRNSATFIAIAITGLLSGCQEPGYRTEVSPTGQGGVEVRRVEKEDPPQFAPAPVAARKQAAAAPSNLSIDQRIDALEARQRENEIELDRLRLEKAARDAK